jgi:hypothetical protein
MHFLKKGLERMSNLGERLELEAAGSHRTPIWINNH